MSRWREAPTRFSDWEFDQPSFRGAQRANPESRDSGFDASHRPGMTRTRTHHMPAPQHVFDPPFNIIRCSHAVLDVTDLRLSRDFYETTVGLHVEDADDTAVYLRGSEEHQHH